METVAVLLLSLLALSLAKMLCSETESKLFTGARNKQRARGAARRGTRPVRLYESPLRREGYADGKDSADTSITPTISLASEPRWSPPRALAVSCCAGTCWRGAVHNVEGFS
jgi:hypothetical protein